MVDVDAELLNMTSGPRCVPRLAVNHQGPTGNILSEPDCATPLQLADLRFGPFPVADPVATG